MAVVDTFVSVRCSAHRSVQRGLRGEVRGARASWLAGRAVAGRRLQREVVWPRTPHMTGHALAAERPPKDYSQPLHVDCSIEYELPESAKPPPGAPAEPLLMIHPAHFRRLEAARRVPFVNNLPPAPRRLLELLAACPRQPRRPRRQHPYRAVVPIYM